MKSMNIAFTIMTMPPMKKFFDYKKNNKSNYMAGNDLSSKYFIIALTFNGESREIPVIVSR